MSEETTPAGPPPPADQPVRDDLVIDDMLQAGDPDLECARTVGDLRRGFEAWYSRLALSGQFSPVVFAARDGRLLTADAGIVVRPRVTAL